MPLSCFVLCSPAILPDILKYLLLIYDYPCIFTITQQKEKVYFRNDGNRLFSCIFCCTCSDFFLHLLDYFYKITSRSLSALLFFRCKASRLQMPFPFSVPAPFLLHPQKQFSACCLHTGCQKPHFQMAVSP